MFSLSNILDSLDSAAKDTLEEEAGPSATWLRSQRKGGSSTAIKDFTDAETGTEDAMGTGGGSSSKKWMSGAGTTSTNASNDEDKKQQEYEHDALSALANDEVAATPFAKAPLVLGYSFRHGQAQGQEQERREYVSNSDNNNKINVYAGSIPAATIAASSSSSSSNYNNSGSGSGNFDPTAGPSHYAHSSAQSNTNVAKQSSGSIVNKVHASGPVSGLADTEPESEIERLNSECLELEDQVAALKAEVKHAWASYQKAQEQASTHETELRTALQQSGRTQGAQMQAVQSQLHDTRVELEASQRALRDAENAKEEAVRTYQSIRKDEVNLKGKWAEQEERLLAELATLRSGSAIGVETLRRDLQTSVECAERLRLEHALLISQTQKRQAALEVENMELVASLGELQRQRDHSNTHSSTQAGGGRSSSRAEVEALEAAQQVAHQTAAALSEEKIKSIELSRQLHVALAEARTQAAAADDERTRAETAAAAHTRALSILREQLQTHGDNTDTYNPNGNSNSSNASPSSGSKNASQWNMGNEETTRGLQAQVHNLSQQLLRKQQMVLDLQAERGALKSRLQDADQRVSAIERQLLFSSGANGSSGYDDDDVSSAMEAGIVMSNTARRRGGGNGTRLGGDTGSGGGGDDTSARGDLNKYGIRAPARVVGLVDAIDSLTVSIGKTLRQYPLARVGFAAYLVLLHVWVCFVLAMHTHSLEENAVSGGLLAGPGDLVNNQLPVGMVVGRAHLLNP